VLLLNLYNFDDKLSLCEDFRRGYTITPPAPHRVREVGGYQKMADFCRFFSEKLYIIHIMRSLVRFLFYINDLVDYLCLFSSVTADYLTGTAQCFGPVSVGGDR